MRGGDRVRILRIDVSEDGSRPPIQSWDRDTMPEGYAWVPEALDDGRFEAANGFVTMTVDEENTVTAIEENAAARAAWLSNQAQKDNRPSLSARVAALEADAAQAALDRAALTLLLTGEETV